MKPWAIFLMGPTASGKTDIAIALHESIDCEVISVDSAQVYRGMDIGTAKPTSEELAQAPHRLIDIRDPADPYTVADFRSDALHSMRSISARGSIPLLVGGTMLYFNKLLYGHAKLPSACYSLRATLSRSGLANGNATLHDALKVVDPVAAARINHNDFQRILRAIEVDFDTGRSLTENLHLQECITFQWRICAIALMLSEREELHRRISCRFEKMLSSGFLGEVEALRQSYEISVTLPVGYRQVCAYIDGALDLRNLRNKCIAATLQLAKHQMTWLRRWPDLHLLDAEAPKPHILDEILKIINGRYR